MEENQSAGEVTSELTTLRLANERKVIIRALMSLGWSRSGDKLSFRVGGGDPSPGNPEGLRTLDLRITEDLTVASFFMGSRAVGHVPLKPGDPHGNEWRITRLAGTMDHGLVRPEPAPLPDDFSPVQVINYLYERYASRLGTIKMNHLYEVRTESWSGLCAAQRDNHLADVYVPSFYRHPSGKIAGMYHCRVERHSEWAERAPIQYEPGSVAGNEALERARRLGVEFPTEESPIRSGIRQVVKTAKMGF